MELKYAQQQVEDFHKAFGHPVGDKPTMLDPERLALRHKWLTEEVDEMLAAKNPVELSDAIGDAIVISIGTAVEAGISISEVFDIIMSANMAKLGPDGKPIYKDDGKIAKPEGWVPPEPDIEEELFRQGYRP